MREQEQDELGSCGLPMSPSSHTGTSRSDAPVMEERMKEMRTPFKSYPRGRLNTEDEGAIEIAVGVQQDVVIIAFPKLVSWVGLPAEQAEDLAETIQQRAKEARRNRQ